MVSTTSLAERLSDVQRRIEGAAARAGRDPAEITLVAVTKTHPPELIADARGAGMRHFGENRSDELAEKVPALAHLSDVTWHFIGTLQSRQTRAIAQYADVFHGLDRMKIARRLSAQLEEYGRKLPCFVEVNVSGEGSKAGFEAANWEADAAQREQLAANVATIAALPRIELQGLMTMAPWDAAPQTIRRVFQRTRELAQWLTEQVAEVKLDRLSMGMTDDFEIAVEEGATHVRVGRALFGARRK